MEAKINYLSLLEPFNIKPNNNQFYIQALTHISYTYEKHLEENFNYEKLEFIGDAVFQLVCAEFVYNLLPKANEGELTKLRSKLVRTEAFAKLGRELNLHEMMYLGHGEEKGRGQKDKIIENVVEAFMGAIFLDQGYDVAKEVCKTWLNKIYNELDEEVMEDYKSKLQELIQSDSREPLQYEMIKSVGKDNEKTFFYRVTHDGVILGEGEGKSKKQAEQAAAKSALNKLAK